MNLKLIDGSLQRDRTDYRSLAVGLGLILMSVLVLLFG